MKDKKYYRNYYRKNKERINKNKKLRMKAKKQLMIFDNQPVPFSCLNRGGDANNYKRMFLEDNLQKKEYRDYLIDFYKEKGKQLIKFNQFCFVLIILLFINNIITNNSVVFIVNTTFQFLFLTLQFINLFVHRKNVKNLERLYE